ncbi:putative dihydrofolate synthetase [Gracilariopsis chorda]|uniref:Putative dihydrofolate synthetase n=1 Tax=Gracilariopsis chorda TaxID=448386 RepID=A0A2V3J2M6_9FLOR|nr:putative dihydrofolate synthetase [Gracilariopsis chorda]|eukprot:PXF48658.1 putative dihydrofolate synthetase [Gracilariopsis chorda]
MISARMFRGSGSPSCTLEKLYRRLDELVDWERCRRANSAGRLMRVSAKPARDLLKRLGDPQKSFSAVHITGSKGKGSVAALIAEGLRRAPFVNAPVGTYGSPHVERVNERIRINGTPIDDELLQRVLGDALQAMETPTLLERTTWFDAVSAAGLLAFHYSGVKWGVVEVGMGGRLDSTNVLAAPVSVITNIHFEHANVIGPTLKDIAYEKAGIIAPSAQVNLLLARKALELVAHVEGCNDVSGETLLPRQTASSALARLPARQERFVAEVKGRSVTAVLDGAHTPESVYQVLRELREDSKPVIVLGIGEDKDCDAICEVVASEASQVFATMAGTGDAFLQAAKLGVAMQKLGTSTSVVQNAEEALHHALEMASSERTRVVIIGSLHLAGRLRGVLTKLQNQHSNDKTTATP